MRTLTSTRIVRIVLAPLLSLWVAGGGCLIGCEGIFAAAAAHGGVSAGRNSEHKLTIAASGHACPANESHHCCAKSTAETKPKAQRTSTAGRTRIKSDRLSSGMMEGCPLAVGKAAVAAKVRKDEVSAAPAHLILPAENFLEQTAPLSNPLRLPNRGHTYLRCCVFLI